MQLGSFSRPLTAGLIHDKHVVFQGVSAYIPDSEGTAIVNLAEQRERKFVRDDCTYREGATRSSHRGHKSKRFCEEE